MNCPKCNSEVHTVVDTRDPNDKATTRRHWCGKAACSTRWNTTERVDRDPHFTTFQRTQDFVPRAPPSVVLRHAQRTVSDEHNRQGEETQQTRSVSSLSDLDPIPSPLSLLPDPDLFPKGDQGVDHETPSTKKGGPIVYAAAFDEFWSAIRSNRSKGLKSEAFRRWTERGKPPADVLIAKWDEFMQSLGDTFAMDVCRWINARGWLETYETAPVPARRNGKTAGNVGVLKNWLTREEAKENGR